MFRSGWRQALQIAATYIGTVVGAGFASGQEVWQFFTRYQTGSLIAIGFAALLFFVLGAYVMNLGQRLNASSLGALLLKLLPTRAAEGLQGAMLALLFALTVAMLAGGGALLHEQFGLNPWIGSLATAALALITLLFGMNGILSANSLIVPAMFLLVLIVTGHSMMDSPSATMSFSQPPEEHSSGLSLFLSALSYAGFNLGLAMPVLIPLGCVTKQKNTLRTGAFLGAVGLFVMLAVMNGALARNAGLMTREIPLLELARGQGRFIVIPFAMALWAEIYSTLIANLFGLTHEIRRITGMRERTILVILLTLALAGAQIGFGQIVRIGYPLFGVISGCILTLVIFADVKMRLRSS
ncbi:YkvI family membrane protein [Ferroacidibacillus organovorans]|uniref:Transporter n=1 Tax=Ferroacidibacillus organovorans TaxID=1765683 RepID=A0A162TN84_9BACL|nr:hypothetical protein [Ferroacidibacillus organovorans]KYP80963.1 hypothetical protein AYJ22_09585 [Ferroacidibacillus organovorans]OAG93667.1 hypothetical protein AYW79_09525 [Ferroacidibacillus organovorans]OPG16534.1 hypothetical protein B2M26_06585 [Ferroacidibacillus organovorans]